MKKFLSIAAVTFLTGCANQAPLPLLSPALSIKDDTLIYDGMITGDGVLEALRMIRNNHIEITKLQVTSPGGMIESGIEFGYFIKEKNLDLIITKLCFSACANYLLPAAHSVKIEKDTLLGWHGGARQSDHLWKQSVPEAQWKGYYPYLERLREKEFQFFQYIDVAPNIVTYGQTKLNTCQKAKQTMGWYYTLDDMKAMRLPPIEIEGGVLLESLMYQDDKITSCQMPAIFTK
ncbi:hypothetical protein [Vibrio rumoiensis]|nr:hypothetical protein [Vibrio rumoiensis]